MEALQGCSNIELFSSLSDNASMGRPKNFSREEVLEKATPVLGDTCYGFGSGSDMRGTLKRPEHVA